jgi:hypothetical protein
MKDELIKLRSDLIKADALIDSNVTSSYADHIITDLMRTNSGQKLVLGCLLGAVNMTEKRINENCFKKPRWWHIVFDKEFRDIVISIITLVFNYLSQKKI